MSLRSRRRIERENASRSIPIHLPPGIIEDILSRLPVRSLLRFRSVSKSWHSLIDSERFIKIHLQNTTKNMSFSHHRMVLNLAQRSDQKKLMHCSWHELVNERAANSFEFKGLTDHSNAIKLVGCCNGLVCLLVNRRCFFLWNPSTRMCTKLPDAVDILDGKIVSNYGFGYDESKNDYKVLVIMFCMDPPFQFIHRLFSLKNNSWTTLNCRVDSSVPFGGVGKFASGNLHWNRPRNRDIVSLDLKSESCEIVEAPTYSEGPYSQSLGVTEGCLSVVCLYKDSHSDIWVMKKYGVKESWVKVVTLPCNRRYSGLNTTSHLFCRGLNGEVVLIYGSGFMIYYPKDNIYRYFPRRIVGSVVEADVYVESLVSPHSGAKRERLPVWKIRKQRS